MESKSRFVDEFLARSPEQATALQELLAGSVNPRTAAIKFTSIIRQQKTAESIDSHLAQIWYTLVTVATVLLNKQEQIVDLIIAIGKLRDTVIDDKVVIRWSEFPQLVNTMHRFTFTRKFNVDGDLHWAPYRWRYQDRKGPAGTPPARKSSFAARLFARRKPQLDFTTEAMTDIASALERPSPIPPPSSTSSTPSLTPSKSSSSSDHSTYEPSSSSSESSSVSPSKPPPPNFKTTQNHSIASTKDAENEESLRNFHYALSVAAQWILHAGELLYDVRECKHQSHETKAGEKMEDWAGHSDGFGLSLHESGVKDSDGDIDMEGAKPNWELPIREYVKQSSGELSATKVNSRILAWGQDVELSSRSSDSLTDLETISDVDFSCVESEDDKEVKAQNPGDVRSPEADAVSEASDFSQTSSANEGITARRHIKPVNVVYPSCWEGSPGFTKRRWDFWKERCMWIVSLEGIPGKTREWAKSVANKMGAIEEAAKREPQTVWESKGGHCVHF